MVRELKPCGTFAAYQRHVKAKEEPCEPCRAAARDQKNSRMDGKRRASGESRLSLVPAVVPDVLPDPLETARDSLLLVEAALRSSETSASSVASLTRRREELVSLILSLSKPAVEEVSTIDKFAARRAERIAKAQA